jgi:hypothetical protein
LLEGKQIIPDFAALMRDRAQAIGVDYVERACELTDRYTNSSVLTAGCNEVGPANLLLEKTL